MRGGEFAGLAAFMTVARERSFRRAATRLGLSPSALSHTIRGLEERLGARLLNRTTRSVSPTEAGKALFDRLGPALSEIESAVREIGAFQAQPSGRVRLNLPRLAASVVLMPTLRRFVQTYPEIRLDLTIDDGFTDVVANGFDAGIRLGERVERDMIAVRLTPDLRLAVVGAPAYFAGRPFPASPRELGDHACINYHWSNSGAIYRWQFEGPEGPLEVDVKGQLTANDTGLIIDAALDGVGLACLPEISVVKYLEAGRLIRVLEDWCRPFSGFFLYYPGRRQMPASLRAIMEFFRLPPVTA